MTLDIRRCASLADVEEVGRTMPMGRFHREAFGRTDGSVYLLGWVDDAPVAHLLVTPRSAYDDVRAALGDFPEAGTLDVLEPLRRRGLGAAMMRAASAVASDLGSDRLGLAVEPDNAAAVGLYRSLGFSRHRELDVVAVWQWLDDDGVEHEEREPCHYWTRRLTT